MDEIDHQQIVEAKCGHLFSTNLLKETQEFRILNIATQSEPYRVTIRMGEIGQRFTLLNALAEDAVKPLPGPFDQSAFAEDFSDTAIARILLSKDVLRSDAGWESPWTDDLDASWILAHEDGTSMTIFSVTHCVQDGLAEDPLIEGRHVPDKEPLLEVLQVISLVDESPDLVEYGKKTLSELMSFYRRSRHFVGTVFKNNLCLGEILAQGFARAQQNQSRICHLAIDE